MKKCCKEIKEIKSAYLANLLIYDNIPPSTSTQCIIGLLLEIIAGAGLNPIDIEFTVSSLGIAFSFIVKPNQLRQLSDIFGTATFTGLPITSVTGLSRIIGNIPPGVPAPLVDYSVTPSLVFYFCRIPGPGFRQKLSGILSTVGILGNIQIIGKVGVVSYSSTIVPVKDPQNLLDQVYPLLKGGSPRNNLSRPPRIPCYF